jgi:signal transduction histidine kinase
MTTTRVTQPSGFGRRARITGYAAEQVLWFPVLVIACVVTVVGAGLSLIAVGLPVFQAGLLLTRAAADRHRTLADRITGVPLPDPHRPVPEAGWLVRLRARVEDPMTWRELLWTVVAASAGFVLALTVVVVFLTVVGGLVWWFAAPVLMGLRANLDRALLHYARAEQLEVRVAELTETRAEVVDHSAAELRRIERDLHDGAQARLVALAMTLGQADDIYEQDAELARKMIVDARSSTQAALGDLRSVVRSIHPPVLADRGLAGAVESLANDMALPAAGSGGDGGLLRDRRGPGQCGQALRRRAPVDHPAPRDDLGRRAGGRASAGGHRGRRQRRRRSGPRHRHAWRGYAAGCL